MGLYGYSEKKLQEKAEKRGLTLRQYCWYLEQKSKKPRHRVMNLNEARKW